MNKFIMPVFLALTLIMFLGCVQQDFQIPQIVPELKEDLQSDTAETYPQTKIKPQKVALDAPKKFESVEQIRKYLADNTITQSYAYNRAVAESAPSMDIAGDMFDRLIVTSNEVMDSESKEYSQTNVQVEGIDEPDFLKTDGDYIYLISFEKLVVVDARDPENAKIVFEQKLFDAKGDTYSHPTPKQMFISNDKLAIFASVPKKEIIFDRYDIVPKEQYQDYTGLYVFDISEPKNPELLSEMQVLGNYYQARMQQGIIYFVSAQNTYSQIIQPPIIYQGDSVYRPEVYYFDNPQEKYVFNTITSYDIEKDEMVESKSYLMGHSSTLMMSQNNMYIAYQKRDSWCRWCYDQQYDKERFEQVIVPRLPQELRDEIGEIENKQLDEQKEWQQISELLKEYFAPALSEDIEEYEKEQVEERQQLLRKIADALAEYDAALQIERTKTIIHKFRVNEGNIEYAAQGDVHGHLLNQFSLDEHDGDLRVATTVDVWAKKRIQYNNVFVLDQDMQTIGAIEKIAQNESIYSARFMGDRLYLVTFKKIDPFFAIDLSDAKNPQVLGELKIAGYSSYLHPYDENLIIGIGKQTEQNKWGGVTTKGVKISLFDVTEPQNPKEIDMMEFGDSGSDSAVLYDHKAFLLDARNELMVLPLKVVMREEGLFSDKTGTWDGAAVVRISRDGFEQYGNVKHDSREDYWGGWRSKATVRRSLYIEDALYTISDSKILVNEIAEDMPRLAKIELRTQQGGLIGEKDIAQGTIIPQIRIPFFQ